MDDDLNIFSVRLKELRLKSNMTQKELADKIEVSANTIISYEKSQKAPSLDLAKKLAMFFNVSLDWMCGIAENTEFEAAKTCDNVIRELIRLDNLLPLVIRDVTIYEEGGFSAPEFEGRVAIIPSKAIVKFLTDWQKMKGLYYDGSIDKDLYDLWLDKQLSDKRGKKLDRDMMLSSAVSEIAEDVNDEDLPF